MKKGDSKGKRTPPKKKVVIRSLEALEEERRERRLDALHEKFSATLKHMSEVEKVYEDYYRAKKSLAEAGKSSIHREEPRKDRKARP